VAMELMVRGVLCGGQCRPQGSRRHRVGHAETRENCTKLESTLDLWISRHLARARAKPVCDCL
jgi:hypothetical protein